MYKFQKLKVYGMALEYIDEVYELGRRLPDDERFNLRGQLERAAVSIALNIAEGSTGLTDPEQSRFLGMAVRSYLESVACIDIIERRNYLETAQLEAVRDLGHEKFVRLQAFRKRLNR